MARDAVTLQDLSLNAGTIQATGTTVNATNGASIDVDGNTQKLLIMVQSSSATYDVTVSAGVGVQRWQGDLVQEVAAGELGLFVIESAQFIQSGGVLYVDFEAGADGTINAVRLPKGS